MGKAAVLLTVILFCSCVYAAGEVSQAKVSAVTGEVEVLVAARKIWEPATLGTILNQEDGIRTKNGKVELTFDDGSKISLKENTSLDLIKLKTKELTEDTIIKLWFGKIKAKFNINKNDSSLEIRTKHIAAAVKGTEFILDADDSDTRLIVLEGIVSLTDAISKKEIFVKANEKASYASVFQSRPEGISPDEQKVIALEWGEGLKLAEEKTIEETVTSATPATETKTVPQTEPPAQAVELSPSQSQKGAPAGLGENFGGTFGAVSVDGKTYYMLSLMLELTLGKFGAGFDVRLLWNDDGIKEDDWNDWKKSIASMFKYVRYGLKGEEFYAKLGIIDNASLGHGFLMRRYSNVDVDLYKRTFGTELDFNLGGAGIETVTNDIMWERLLGARAYLDVIPSLVHIGVTGIYDYNPAKDKYYKDGSGNQIPYAEQTALFAYGGDIGVSLVKTDLLSVLVYADWAKIGDHGEGYAAPGFRGKIAMFDYQLEYRNTQADFIPGLFDYLYEERRPIDWTSSNLDPNNPRKKGVFGELTFKPINELSILGSLEKYEGNNPYVRGEASYKGNLIPKVSEVAVGYEQKDVVQLELKNPNTVVYARAGLNMSAGVILVLTVKQTYDPVFDKFKRSTIMAIQMKF